MPLGSRLTFVNELLVGGGATCPDTSTVLQGVGGGTTTGDLIHRVFSTALSSCSYVHIGGQFQSEAFDSTLGSLEPATFANVAANADVSWTNGATIDGNLSLDGPLDSLGTVTIEGNLAAGGPITAGSTVTIDGNASTVDPLPPELVVDGTVSSVSSMAPPVDCTNLIPVPSIVTARQSPNNDDPTIGLDPAAASGSNAAQIDLPCGNFYLAGITPTNPLTIAVHGNAILYVDGDVAPAAGLSVTTDPGATVDLFVHGSITAASDIAFGSQADPGACRLYSLGGVSSTGGAFNTACNVYLPNLDAYLPNTQIGAVFARSIQSYDDAAIHWDRTVLNATSSSGCTAASCDDGNACTWTHATPTEVALTFQRRMAPRARG